TLLIELRESERIREGFQELLGLDRHVALAVGEQRLPASFEGGRQTEDKISAGQDVRFSLAGVRRALADGASLTVVVDHPNYAAKVALDEATRASVVGGVLDPAVADAALRWVRDGVR